MKKFYILLAFLFFIFFNVLGQVTGDFRSKTGGTGNWNDFNAWETYNGTSWIAASTGQLPTATSTTEIKAGDAMVVNASGLLSGNLNVNGSLSYHTTTVSSLTVSGSVNIGITGSFTSPASGTVLTHALNIGGSTAAGVGGNLVVNGVFNMNAFPTAGVVVTFFGSSNNTISGSGTTINFYSIVVNKGTSNASILEATSIISCSDATSAVGLRLSVTIGTFKLSSASTLKPFYGSVQPTQAVNARLWMNNASATIQGVGAGTASGPSGTLTFGGMLQIDAGTLSYGNGASTISVFGNYTIGGANSTLNVYGSFTSGSATIGTITAGNINIYGQLGANYAPTTYFSQGGLFQFGGSALNFTGGTLTIVDPTLAVTSGLNYAPFSFYISGGTNNFAGSTIRFGNGISDLEGGSGFVVSPGGAALGTVIINNSPSSIKTTRNVTLLANTNIAGNLTINSGVANKMLLGAYALTLGGNLTNGGTITSNNVSTNMLTFNGAVQQIITNTGTFLNNIPNLTINNSSLTTPSVDIQVPLTVSTALNLTKGQLGSSNASVLTLGNSVVSTTFTMTRNGGTLASLPTFALSGVTYNAIYNAPTVPGITTTGFELPVSTNLGTFTVNNTSGVILDKTVNCTTLSLTAGILTATSSNSIVVTGPLTTSITGGSSTSYVNGPLTRTIPNNAVAANYKYQIGKTSYRLFEFSSLTTGGTGTGTITLEAFDAGPYSGTAGTGLSSINTDKYWTLTGALGLVTISSSNIKLADTGLLSYNRVGQSNNVTGTYNNIGGTVTGGTSVVSVNPIDYSVIGTGTNFRIGSATGISAGTYAIGPQASYEGYAGAYPTIAAAVTAITAVPLSGNVIFEFQPDYVPTIETYPIALSSVIMSNAAATVTFRPALGVSNIINFSGTTSIITNSGADYIIFDGRNGGTGTNKYFQFTSSSLTTSTIVLSGDAQYNKILYSIIKGSNSTATTGSIVAINTPTTGNNFYTIDHCNFDASSSANNCLYSTGVATDATITNNNFYDFRNGGAINLASGSNNALIDNNNIYQTTTNIGLIGTTSGIIVTGGNNVRISNNNIGGSGPALAGTWTVSATTPAAYNFTGINATSLATISKIYNNKIQNFDWKSTPATWTGINASGEVNIGTDGANFVGSNTGNDIIKVTYFTTNGNSQINGINAGTGTTVNIENNNIGSITTVLSGVTGVGSSFTGISSNATTLNIKNNIIGSTTTLKSINAANQSTTGSTQNIYGIVAGGTTNTVTGNTIANMYSDMTFSSTSAGMIRGIKITGGNYYLISSNSIYSLSTPQPMSGALSGGTSYHNIVGIDIYASNNTSLCNITGNSIYDLANTSASASINVLGIYCQTSPSYGAIFDKNYIHSFSTASNTAVQTGIHLNYGGPCTIQNNVIRLGIDKAGNSITSTAQINGIVKASGYLCNIYFNTIYIGGSGVVAGTVKTYAFNLTLHATEDIRNNIFINARTNAIANQLNYAVSLSGTLTSGFSSDYNIYYVSSTDGKLALVSNVDKLSLSALQSALPGNDIHTGFGDPLLVNPTAALVPMDLKLSNLSPAEGTGTTIGTVTDDINGVLRASNTPTDMGAYAVNVTPPTIAQDIFSPAISYLTMGNGSSIINRLTSANFAAITDNINGINVTSGTRPRLYYKLSTNASAFVGNTPADNGWKWVEASGSTTPFNFNIDYSLLYGGPVAIGSIIQYFVVAQNSASTAIVSFNPSIGASGTSVATVLTAPTTPNSYTIVPSFPIAVNVGTGQTYTTLTGAGGYFAAINAGTISANTVATITSDISEPGTTSLNLVNEEGPNAGTLTLTVQSDGTPHVISGTAVTASSPMISITGAKRLIIDGGYTKLLTFRNTNLTPASTGPVIQFSNNSQNCMVQNCIIESNSTSTSTGALNIGSGANSVSISQNDIRDARGGTTGSPTNGIFSNNNIANTLSITNNNIYNQKNATSYGIYLNSVANGCIVTGNSLYMENGFIAAGPYTGIFLQNSYNHLVSGNYIGGSAPLCGGSVPFTNSGAAVFTGIYLYLTSTQTSTIQGNTIQNISMTNTGNPTFYGINNTMYGAVNLIGNVIGSVTTANSIQIAGTGVSAGINQTYGYVLNPCRLDNNTIANITLTNATGSPVFYGMKTYSNWVRKNSIYNIGTSANIGVTIYGIYNSFNNANSFTNEFSNNVISLNGGASTTPTIYGFYESSTYGTTGFYYNSINLNGTASGTAPSYAFYRSAAGIYNFNDNILVNSRTGGTGIHYAIYSVPTTLFTSNYNDFYVSGTTLGHWGAAGIPQDKADIIAWRTATGQDANSISSDPQFTASTNLQPFATSPVLGIGIPVASVTTDIVNNTRSLAATSLGAYEVSSNKALTLKVFLQGLYNTTNSNMNQCQDYVNAVPVNKFTGTIADTITVELHDAVTYSTIVYRATGIELNQNGTCNSTGLAYVNLPGTYTGSYYITIKTRNHLETTSAAPVSFATNAVDYNFTDVAAKAFGSNMILLNANVYGLYAGDVNKLGAVNLFNLSAINSSAIQQSTGYLNTDINGDGIVNLLDLSKVNTNVISQISKLNP
ncbi:MAG: hypothetical protein PHT07_02685 [Paludibacter sp.]|nr:hypothetical protein [Paludibacter sp.]